MKARKMIIQREERNTSNGEAMFLEAENLKEEGGWVKMLLQERKSMKAHGSEKAIC